jgi:hypothetical protein
MNEFFPLLIVIIFKVGPIINGMFESTSSGLEKFTPDGVCSEWSEDGFAM